jgi:hypothetical protein
MSVYKDLKHRSACLDRGVYMSNSLIIKKYFQYVGLFSKKYFKNWWVINLGNVFVMREKFLERIEESKQEKEKEK